jgi:hypothetical protein
LTILFVYSYTELLPMDILQITLLIALIVLTINLTIIGVYVFLVLKEFRETVIKANMVLDNVHDVTDAVSSPIATVAGVVGGLTQSIKAIKSISSLFEKEEE